MEDSVLEKVEEYLDGKVEITCARNENIGKITDYIQGRKPIYQLSDLHHDPFLPGI